jgi:hypothetical protein
VNVLSIDVDVADDADDVDGVDDVGDADDADLAKTLLPTFRKPDQVVFVTDGATVLSGT